MYAVGSRGKQAVLVALFGGTGRVGGAVLRHVLARGHEVRGLARVPAKLAPRERSSVVEGDPLDPAAVARTMEGVDATVCALGLPPWSRGRLVGPATRNILAAASSGHRVVCVSALGIGASRPALPSPVRFAMRFLASAYVADKDEQEALLRASDTDWTLVRPSLLRPGPARGDVRTGPDGTIRLIPTTFEDVGAFIAGELEAPRHPRAAVCIAGR